MSQDDDTELPDNIWYDRARQVADYFEGLKLHLISPYIQVIPKFNVVYLF